MTEPLHPKDAPAAHGGETFAQRMRAARQARRMTLAELASEVSLSPQCLLNIEHGKTTPRTETMVLIAAALAIPLFERGTASAEILEVPDNHSAARATGAQTYGARMKAARHVLGMTLNELAERTGLLASALWAIESARDGASVESAYKIAAALGLTLDLTSPQSDASRVQLSRQAMGGFGSAMREARQRLGLSLEDLSRQIGVSPSRLNLLEAGRLQPTAVLSKAVMGVLFPNQQPQIVPARLISPDEQLDLLREHPVAFNQARFAIMRARAGVRRRE